VNHCQPRKSRRDQHGTFNVDMGVYKAWSDKRQGEIRGNAIKYFNGINSTLPDLN